MDQLINLDTAYWARITAQNGYPTYFVLWVDRVSRSMADPYPILRATTINGYDEGCDESFYYKGYVPTEWLPRDLQFAGCTVLDLEPLDHCSRQKEHAPAIDPNDLQEFL